jgi:transcription antitermination factor NusG
MATALAATVAVSTSWFAVKVRARSEDLVAQFLQAKGFDCLLPTYPERRRYSDRLKEVQSALFPGYVFCCFDPVYRLPIITTPMVHEVVSFGRMPCPVAEEEVLALQQIISSRSLARPWPYHKAGHRVRIEDGPLKGVEGLLVSEKGRDRLVVSVHLLQRSVAVEIERDAVRPN